MKKLTILFLLISSALFGQVNLQYINVNDSLEIREQGTALQFFQFDATNGITFPDGSTQLTAGAAGREITAERAKLDTVSANDNSEILFIDPIVAETATADTFYVSGAKNYSLFPESDGAYLSTPDFKAGVLMGDGVGYRYAGIFNNSPYGAMEVAVRTDPDTYIKFQDGTDVWNFNNGEWFNTTSPDTLLKSEGDTIFEEDKTAKLKNLYATDGIQGDNIKTNSQTMGATTVTGFADSKTVMEGTEIDKLQFTKSTQAYSEGTAFYDTNDKALVFYNDIPDFTHQLGYEHVIRFYNNTGSTITSGTIIRSVGSKVNGSISFLGDLSGIGSIDSLNGIAMVTADVLSGSFGIGTLIGQVNNLNISTLRDNQVLYASHAGLYDTINPEPPNISQIIGRVVYADADSGAIYFYGFSESKYSPAPTFSAFFSRESEGIANGGIDVFANITNATNDLFTETNNAGFLFQGDSLSPLQDGIYTLSFSYSFQGDAAQNDDWRVGIFKNGVEAYSTLRTSSLTNKGGVPFEATNSATSGDWFSFKISNTTSATRTSTFIDGVISITFND